MRSRATIFVLAGLVAAFGAAPAHALLHGPSKVRLIACEPAVEQAERFAVFEGEMRPVARATRMQMRLTLQARTPERSGWKKVSAPGLGVWNTATSGVRRYVFTKRIENLFAPADYRVVVKYRWLDLSGLVVSRDERRAPVCRQPDQRPNLLPTELEIEPGSSRDRRTYVIPLVNKGRTGAAGFTVRLTINGRVQPIVSVAGLLAGEGAMVSLEGPACTAGSMISAVVDADAAVDEADEADNALSVSCPSET